MKNSPGFNYDVIKNIELKPLDHPTVPETVNHPSHYQGKTEVIDIIEQAVDGLSGPAAFSRGNAVKYIMRAGKKGDAVTDLEKAIWYIKRELEGK